MKKITTILILIFTLLCSETSFAFTKSIGKGYCQIRHPIETLTSVRTSCESQHVIQQQSGGSDDFNTIWINTVHHDYLDRSKDRPWANDRPWLSLWGDDHLEQAYMMGTYANGYHFMLYNHHGNGMPTLVNWDGASHILYAVSSIANYPAKELAYVKYQFSKGSDSQFIDSVIGLAVDFSEIGVGVSYSIIGVLVGTVLNPLDTLSNIVPAILLIMEAVYESITNLIAEILSIVTFGLIG